MVQPDLLPSSGVKNKRNLSLFRSYRSRRSTKQEEKRANDDGTDVTEEDRSHGRASPLIKEVPKRDTPTTVTSSITRQATGFATPGKASDHMQSPSSLQNARLPAYKMRQPSTSQTPSRAVQQRNTIPNEPVSSTTISTRSPSPAFQARQNVFGNQNSNTETNHSKAAPMVRDASPAAFQTRRSVSRARATEQHTTPTRAAWPPSNNTVQHVIPEAPKPKEDKSVPSDGGWASFGDNSAPVAVERAEEPPAQSSQNDKGWASFGEAPKEEKKAVEQVKTSTPLSRAAWPPNKSTQKDVEEKRPSLNKHSWPPQKTNTPERATPFGNEATKQSSASTQNYKENQSTYSSTVQEAPTSQTESVDLPTRGPTPMVNVQRENGAIKQPETVQSRPDENPPVRIENNPTKVETPMRSSQNTAATPVSAKSNASFSPLSNDSPQERANNRFSSKHQQAPPPPPPQNTERNHLHAPSSLEKKLERTISPPNIQEMQKKAHPPPIEITTPVDRQQAPMMKQLSPSTDVTAASSSATLVTFNSFKGKNVSNKDPMTDVIRKDLWSSDQETVWVAMLMVAAEAAASDTNRSLIARSGGLFAVVRAMEMHKSVAKIQIAGCQALEKLAIDSDNELAIEQVGGFEAVLAAMMGHFEDVLVNEAAWSTLMNLTCANSDKELTLDTDGGLDALLEAMKKHIDSPIVQKNACGALANLCGHHSKRMQSFSEANGFILLATIMQKYWNQPDVRAEACHAMSTLCDPFLASNKSYSVVATAIGTPVTRNGAVCVHGGPQIPSSNRVSNGRRYDTDLHSVASGMSYWEEETVYTVHE